jgi:ribonuclease HII
MEDDEGIIGIDEVGRGAWAGPMVFAAVKLAARPSFLSELNDSKVVGRKKREELAEKIKSDCFFGFGEVSPEEIDKLGLTKASSLACLRALAALGNISGTIVIDGTCNYLAGTDYESRAKTLVNGDAVSPAISAASIVAKVFRDTLMASLAEQYRGYGFEKHVGYGTALHRQALASLGITPLHRRSYKPIKEFL